MGKGGMGGRHAATTQGFSGEVCDALAVAHPRESASSYLSSQSLAASRCSLHATSRSSHSRRSLPCHFLLCRVVLFFLVLRRRRLPVPCSRGFFRLSAQLRPPRGVSWPLESIELPRARTIFLTPTPIICLQVMLLLRSTLS